MITVVSPSRYKVGKKKLRSDVRIILDKVGVTEQADVNIIFVGKRKMLSLTSKYKHEDVALPVLAFPYHDTSSENSLLGEVILCYPQVVLLAAERGKKVEDTFLNLIEHGVR